MCDEPTSKNSVAQLQSNHALRRCSRKWFALSKREDILDEVWLTILLRMHDIRTACPPMQLVLELILKVTVDSECGSYETSLSVLMRL